MVQRPGTAPNSTWGFLRANLREPDLASQHNDQSRSSGTGPPPG
jgi:hypothetical protein